MAKIEKIVLNVGKKSIELSMSEARELKNILAELFGADKERYITREVYRDSKPWWDCNWPYQTWMCNGSGNTLSLGTSTSTPQEILGSIKGK